MDSDQTKKKLDLWQKSKPQVMAKLYKLKCDKTLKKYIVTKLKNLTSDKTHKFNYDQAQKLKFWPISKT